MVVWLKQAKTDIWKLSFQSHISFYSILNMLSPPPPKHISVGRDFLKPSRHSFFFLTNPPHPLFSSILFWNLKLCFILWIFVLFSFNIQGTNWESYISAAENSIWHLTFYVNLSPSCLCDNCSKIVAKNYKAVCCNKSNMWVHMVCNNQSKYCCRKLQNDNSPWFCLNCLGKAMSFTNLSNNQFKTFMSGKTILLPCLVEENQNDQINPQEFSVAI